MTDMAPNPRSEIDTSNPQHVSDILIRFLNGANDSKVEMLVECISQEHRTLQQKFSGFVVHWIKNCVYNKHGHDGRNEVSVTFWKDLAPFIENRLPSGLQYFRRFPIV